MLPVIWSRQARRELGQMVDYIRIRNAPAAERLRSRIEDSVERVATHPYLHRPGRVEGTREAVVHPNYLFVYAVQQERILILRVLHARQQYP